MSARAFHPAFDMPNTADQARAVLAKWGDPLVMTFCPRRAKRCGELLSAPTYPVPVVEDVLVELTRATAKFPTWPTDPLHAMGVLHEEVGELAKAVLQVVYEPHKSTLSDVRAEAVQAAAMALRFLLSIDRYTWNPGDQHDQAPTSPIHDGGAA